MNTGEQVPAEKVGDQEVRLPLNTVFNVFEDETQFPKSFTSKEMEIWDQIQLALSPVMTETMQAMNDHPPFNSAHEAYAIMQEESEEMWDAIKQDDIEQARKECIQTAAMCLRFLIDIKPRPLIP